MRKADRERQKAGEFIALAIASVSGRSPVCGICSACNPKMPCNPACTLCWPDDTD